LRSPVHAHHDSTSCPRRFSETSPRSSCVQSLRQQGHVQDAGTYEQADAGQRERPGSTGEDEDHHTGRSQGRAMLNATSAPAEVSSVTFKTTNAKVGFF
jgi:hypothetical protein